MDPIDSAKEASSFDKNDSILSIDSTDPFLLATFSWIAKLFSSKLFLGLLSLAALSLLSLSDKTLTMQGNDKTFYLYLYLYYLMVDLLFN